ncbi:glycosyltransferase [Chroococcidiopsis sp. CCMEE 29]|uniref:glycosyltransferase n=1 Tax=Chroococcidiopsis sp. CCMEE 29 TaxID=155894 RepID=UPI0020221AAC|nr:glycosyltransferase [Chroococcidiopsis sp. CCMEE 29]
MPLSYLSRIGFYFNFFISRLKGRIARLKVFSFKPEQPSRGNVLISYVLEPFFCLERGQPIPNYHTQHWECMQMVKTFLDLGYCVDVISLFNDLFVPKKDYSIFIDVRWNLERLAPLLNKDCVRIVHIDTAHYLFHNAAECNRLLALQQRRRVTLIPRRLDMPHLAIEHAHCATTLGNEFTINTHKYANKPIYRIPISAPEVYPWSEDKDFEACRKRFLWFGSGGLVHKGLDLVLEAFAEMPDYDLTICGPITKEKDFEQAFYQELYQTLNIHTIGWIDVNSPKFLEITNSCIGIIYPSCSEGGGGCVITCMHAGLIPIVSYEASVDVHDDFGVILKECSIEEIKNTLRRISSCSGQELKGMARKSWEFARANHTKEKFAQEYRNVVENIIASYGKS